MAGDSPFRTSLVSPHAERATLTPPHLLHTLRTGQPAYEHLFGESVFDFAARDATGNQAFNDGMASNARDVAPAIASAYDWASVAHVVDVGGGTGELVGHLLQAFPGLRATLFDLPHVVTNSQAVLAGRGIADRCHVAAGDFFSDVPAGGDCYLLSSILHDWDDERASAILMNCRRSMAVGARLIVAETLVPPGSEPHPSKYLDMQLLLTFGGIERTEVELVEILSAAGFTVSRVMPTTSLVSLLEAMPAT